MEKALEDDVNNKAIQGPDGGPNEVAQGGNPTLKALEDQKIMDAIQNGTSRKALWDDDVKRLIVSPLWEAMIKDQSVRDYVGAVAVRTGDTPQDNEFKTKRGGDIPQDNEFKTKRGGDIPQDNEFKTKRGGDIPQDNEFKAKRGGDTPQDNQFKALEGGDTPQDNQFKALEGGDTPQDNQFKALEGGDTPQDNQFKALEGGDTPQDNQFKALEGGDTPQDNQFKAQEGGDTPQDNSFEAVSDDVREVIESDNFKKSVQDHPGFWHMVADDPGFAKAIQENYEAIDAFGRIPEPQFAKAIEAISEGLDVIQGGESVIGSLARTPEPVFGLVAQDPAFQSVRDELVASGNDR
ncbi:MAG: hypothetical protein WBW88_08495 [Rhodothermales bacterium]